MKYLNYLLRHLRHNWIRTSSTVVAMAICIFLFCTLQGFLHALTSGLTTTSANRLVTRHNVSLVFQMPLAYQSRIEALPGIKRTAIRNWFGGIYIDQKNFFPNFAIQADTFFDMYPEYSLQTGDFEAFRQDLRGAVIGRDLANKYGWNIGDTFQMESSIAYYRVGKPFEFVVRAIYDTDEIKNPGANRSLMFFHYKYLYEQTSQRIKVGTFVVEINNPEQAGAISKTIDTLFENSEAQTRTETEAAFSASFVSLSGNLSRLLNGIGLAVIFTILLVTANTMSMAVRERRKEIAVLKTLGFDSKLVMALILAEGLLLGVLGGLLGTGFAELLLTHFPNNEYTAMFGPAIAAVRRFGLTLEMATSGFGIALLLGGLAGLIPAIGAYRARITDMLRQV
jgi:putative ABC transport system permease protein